MNQSPWCLSQERKDLISSRNLHFRAFTVKSHLYLVWFCLFFLAAPSSLRDLSSLTRHKTCAPCIGSSES